VSADGQPARPAALSAGLAEGAAELFRSADPRLRTFIEVQYRNSRQYLTSSGCPPQEAEEIANDGCLIVANRWERLQADPRYAGREPRAYLYTVVTRLWRRRGPTETRWRDGLLADLTDEGLFGTLLVLDVREGEVDRITASLIVERTLPRLPLPDRQVLWLRLAADFSTTETAGILKIPEGTVKTRLHVAKRRFAQQAIASGTLAGTLWEGTR
jgi:RNA polymerase sigma factor (sigma-70 family)